MTMTTTDDPRSMSESRLRELRTEIATFIADLDRTRRVSSLEELFAGEQLRGHLPPEIAAAVYTHFDMPPRYMTYALYGELIAPRQLIPIWLRIGRSNPWIASATDCSWDPNSFILYIDLDEMLDDLLEFNYCSAVAFVFEDVCLVNQVSGGSEWLVIKRSTAFESLTGLLPDETTEQSKARLRDTLQRIHRATEADCAEAAGAPLRGGLQRPH